MDHRMLSGRLNDRVYVGVSDEVPIGPRLVLQGTSQTTLADVSKTDARSCGDSH